MREPTNDYSASRYERPNHPWVCGLSAEGHACPAGPSAGGRCPALAECTPVRNGDRWECNRSQLRGGVCDAGPTPEGGCGRVLKCHPLRSLRTVRGRFVRTCACLTLGAVMIALGSNWRDRAIAPGPLAQQHAQLLERSGAAANCAACHSAAKTSLAGWTMSLAVTRPDQVAQSQLCVQCHAKTISAEFAVAAHSVPAEVLQAIETKRTFPLPQPKKEGGKIECSACHREHHGETIDLTAIDNAACQTCHQRRFESFAVDHPDFGIWPYERRTRIAFNHASHLSKHFVEKKQAFDCRTCHVEDATGAVQKLASYDVACARCHDEKITTSIAHGVPMLSVPTLDTAELKSAGLDIGPWPKGATGDFDGRLPPAMKLLLSADPAASAAMVKLGADFDFQDVNPKDRQQLEACATLAVAIKRLMSGLATSANAAVRDRLQKALGRSISDEPLNALVGGLSADTLRSAAEGWGFVSVNQTAPAADKTPTPQPSPRRSRSKPAIAFDMVGAWSRDESSLLIRYRPSAHADPVLATWFNLLTETPDLDQRPVAAAMFKELTKPTAPGLCVSCHSVEKSPAGAMVVNWRAFDRSTEPRGFTKFAHGPHMLLPQLADCTHCHAIDDAAVAATSYADVDPKRFVGDFAPISKRQCVECHTAKAAGDACQKCHNYHVETKAH